MPLVHPLLATGAISAITLATKEMLLQHFFYFGYPDGVQA